MMPGKQPDIDWVTSFPIVTVDREDLKIDGLTEEEIALFSDDAMRQVAQSMTRLYGERRYWDDLHVAAREVLKRIRVEGKGALTDTFQTQRVKITYDVQWSDDDDDNNCFGLLTLADLRTFLTTQFYAGNEVVVTKFCGRLQVGRGCYYKHGDGTFSISDESPLIVDLLQLLKLSEWMDPLGQRRETVAEKPCLSFKKSFLRRVLEEAGGPTQILKLKREGEARIFIYAQALNGFWYHMTHSGRYINFPRAEYAQALITALQSYALEQGTLA